MGETYIRIRIRALGGTEVEEAHLLVDTGATYSWISGKTLERIGVKSSRKMKFKTINGEIVERKVGHVLVEYAGDEAPTTTVLAEDGDGNVFGLHGLESLGLEVDPTTQQIRKSEALLAL